MKKEILFHLNTSFRRNSITTVTTVYFSKWTDLLHKY